MTAPQFFFWAGRLAEGAGGRVGCAMTDTADIDPLDCLEKAVEATVTDRLTVTMLGTDSD